MQKDVIESNSISSTQSPSFLQDESWVLQHSNYDPGCITNVELEPFIRAVKEMLQTWVRTGYNSFIHQRLYEKGMPKCLQDAFTTLAAYANRTQRWRKPYCRLPRSALLHSSTLAYPPPTTHKVYWITWHTCKPCLSTNTYYCLMVLCAYAHLSSDF
jgi:hypothetical protein